RDVGGQLVGVGQAGGRVGGGVAGNVPGRLDGLAQRFFGKIGGRGRTAALAGIDGEVKRAVAGLFDGFDVVLAHRDRQAQAFRDFGDRVAGADAARVGQRLLDQFAETGLVGGQGQGGGGRVDE